MAPIHLGLIGLSSLTGEKPATPGDGWAASAHLPYLLSSPRYEITALCNSSVESAKKAVEHYNLPATTKTYGSPEDIANDPDVDLVVCCVRVDRHYKLIKPALEKGKDAFVEWPLGANLQEAEEMAAIAKKSGSKTFVALQGRMAPETQTIKKLVESGKIGRVLTATITADCMGMGAGFEPSGVDYMAKRTWEAIFSPSSLLIASIMSFTLWENSKIFQKETPDQIFVQGTLAQSGTPLSIHVRGGKPFKGNPGVRWEIIGEKGAFHLTSSPLTGDVKLELYDHGTDEVEIVECKYPEAVSDIAPTARNTGLVYEGFVKGVGRDGAMVDFEEAVLRHRFIDEVWRSSEEGRVRSYV
ncbi:NAD(P)-binding protein [Tothia fuscella]|uniref:NAD(P)-binding protein n=1 Tax=Tothia fuscella TaxID=1048955 RepID=A0A9P4P3R9_9PEZI|nr:NAD(P)-binding protein [Tothia fuscella]